MKFTTQETLAKIEAINNLLSDLSDEGWFIDDMLELLFKLRGSIANYSLNQRKKV